MYATRMHCAAPRRDFIRRFGATDIVIGNAGVSVGTLTQYGEDAAVFRAVLDTNVLGLVHTFQPFLDAMLAAHRGTLVGIASVAGFRGLPGAGAYSASKAGAIAYLESLRVEMAGTGVKVVTICPGYVATAMTARNPYRMPFLLPVDKAAELIAAAIARGSRFYVLPWQMAFARAGFPHASTPAVRRGVRARETQAACGNMIASPAAALEKKPRNARLFASLLQTQRL